MHMNLRHSKLGLAALAMILSSPVVLAAKPDATNTGPKTSSLTPITNVNINTDGTVLENFSSTRQITINADNVTLRNFRITTSDSFGIHITGGKNIIIEDGEISGVSSIGIYGGNFTARRIHIFNSGSDAIRPRDAVIEASWIEKLGYKSGAHADGVQMLEGSNVTFRGNNFDMPYNEPGYINSQVFIIQTYSGAIDNILIEDNWINGGGFSIQILDQSAGFGAPTNVRIRNNKFGEESEYGPWRLEGNIEVCGNVWERTNAAMSDQDATTCSGSTPTKKPSPPVASIE